MTERIIETIFKQDKIFVLLEWTILKLWSFYLLLGSQDDVQIGRAHV